MASGEDFDWANHDPSRIRLADLFHDWRITWDELQQQRTGGPAAHRDLIDRLVDLEHQIDQSLSSRTPPPI
jgi:hypothetical protein